MVKLKEINQRKLNKLKHKYPFLEEIIQKAGYVPIFKIDDSGEIDQKLLERTSHDFRYDSGYEYDFQAYAVQGTKLHRLGIGADGKPIYPAPTIKDGLSKLEINPDFIVDAHYVRKKGKEGWEDVDLKIYKQKQTS